jgi:hypothetical protein
MSLGLRITFFVQQRWDVLSWDKLPLRNEPIELTVNNSLRKELNLENWGRQMKALCVQMTTYQLVMRMQMRARGG